METQKIDTIKIFAKASNYVKAMYSEVKTKEQLSEVLQSITQIESEVYDFCANAKEIAEIKKFWSDVRLILKSKVNA